MDGQGSAHCRQTALVVLAFFQADCGSVECRNELQSLSKDWDLTRDINCNRPCVDPQADGDIETDGHQHSFPPISVADIQPRVELQWPGNQEDAVAPQWIAEQLREIAVQFEYDIVAQATNNLQRNILTSPYVQWKNYLTQEVNWVLTESGCLGTLPQERVIMAVTLTLVRGVCEKAPRLLRRLFNTVLQYLSLTQGR